MGRIRRSHCCHQNAMKSNRGRREKCVGRLLKIAFIIRSEVVFVELFLYYGRVVQHSNVLTYFSQFFNVLLINDFHEAVHI